MNGLLGPATGDECAGVADGVPALAALPGGNANVFTRALGLPADPVDAAGQILEALATAGTAASASGLAGSRYFTFNAGIGLDAEVVRAVEGRRAHGRAASPGLYLRMTMRQYYRLTDRRHPMLTLERCGQPPDGPVFLGIVSNTAPWTYLGRRPVNTNPRASFRAPGWTCSRCAACGTMSTLRTLRQMLSRRPDRRTGAAC